MSQDGEDLPWTELKPCLIQMKILAPLTDAEQVKIFGTMKTEQIHFLCDNNEAVGRGEEGRIL